MSVLNVNTVFYKIFQLNIYFILFYLIINTNQHLKLQYSVPKLITVNKLSERQGEVHNNIIRYLHKDPKNSFCSPRYEIVGRFEKFT